MSIVPMDTEMEGTGTRKQSLDWDCSHLLPTNFNEGEVPPPPELSDEDGMSSHDLLDTSQSSLKGKHP